MTGLEWLWSLLQYVTYAVIIPLVVWVFRVENRMSTMEQKLEEAQRDRERNEHRMEEFLQQNREDMKDLRQDIKELLVKVSEANAHYRKLPCSNASDS